MQMDDIIDKKYNSKKIRRKAKALKAKIDKIRRADILERANFCKTIPEVVKDEDIIEIEAEKIVEKIIQMDDLVKNENVQIEENPIDEPNIFSEGIDVGAFTETEEVSVKELASEYKTETNTEGMFLNRNL